MIDPNEAPEGYVAVEYVSCEACALKLNPSCLTSPCTGSYRDDESAVQFKRKGKQMIDLLFIGGVITLVAMAGALFWKTTPPSCFENPPEGPIDRFKNGCAKCAFREDCRS